MQRRKSVADLITKPSVLNVFQHTYSMCGIESKL